MTMVRKLAQRTDEHAWGDDTEGAGVRARADRQTRRQRSVFARGPFMLQVGNGWPSTT